MKRWILNKLLRYLFNAVDADEVLWQSKRGLWYLGEDQLTKEDVHDLSVQANTLKELSLYKQLIKRSKHLANDAIFNRSSTAEDLLFPKAMLKWTEEIERVVNNLANIQ